MHINKEINDDDVILAIFNVSSNNKIITEFYELHRDNFISFAKSYFKIETVFAAEIYQEAYYKMYSNFTDGRVIERTCTLKTYLFSIGRNLIFNELKRRNKLTALMETHALNALPDMDLIEEENDRTRKLSIVSEAVAALNDPCKTILTMFYWGRKKLDEILPALPKYSKIDTLKNQKSKCLDRLEKLLKTEFAKNSILI